MHGNALTTAATEGREDIVSLLLDRGADINAVGDAYEPALTAAVRRENPQMVLLLLGREANINVVGGECGTALATAAFCSKTGIVSQLLTRGADINVVAGIYGTALAAASLGGSVDIVSLILDGGANINVVGGKYGTALATAAFRGSAEIVTLLLEWEANINMVGGEYGTALATAAFGERTNIVSLLLDWGADINMVGGKYGTALATAAFGGRMEIVSLLLDWGADIDVVGSKYGTALAAAVFAGNTDIVSLLLEHGADVLHTGGSYLTDSGVYPNALDVAHSEGSKADSTLFALLGTAISKHEKNQTTDPDVDPVTNVIISRPPFPMPYTESYLALFAGQPKDSLPPTEFCADGSITPEEAEIPCRVLKEDVLSRSLAALVGLGEETIKAKHQWIHNDVRYFIARNFDFGLAYAASRVAWKHFNDHSMDSNAISIQRSLWHKYVQMLDEARSKAIEIDHSNSGQELIISPYSIMPRRLWDLKSNRVVDFRMLHAAQSTTPAFWAVSHSWTSNMTFLQTAINQYQWPVPFPNNITLEYLRSELQNFGAEYIWIDVVCLRQQSEVDFLEQLKRKEWKLDVPTIGNIYRAATNIVRYFNGLGVGFSKSGWDNERHWLQRAWTLQEIAGENITINGGIPRDQGQVFLNSQGEIFGKVMKLRSAIRPVIQLAAQVDSKGGCKIYELAQEMIKRHASQPLDKLSGLFYLLRTTKLPCYDDKMSGEDIWNQCFHLLPTERKAEILFDFPYRGQDEQWFPTWAQVLDWPVRDPECDHMRSQYPPDIVRNTPGKMAFFISDIWIIPDVILQETGTLGEYKVKIHDKLFGFYLPYLKQEPINIQDPIFTLAAMDLGHAYNWVVCRAINEQVWTDANPGVARLRKVGVIRTDFCGELSVGWENGVPLLRKMDCLFV